MPSFTAHALPCRIARAALAAAFALGAVAAHAADFTFSGHAAYNTDVLEFSFDLGHDATDVKVWTDSWQGGTNYDPVAAVWVRNGSGYTLVSEVDDDGSLAPSQGSFDAGLDFASLSKGHYLVTLTASPNYALGTTLADGFSFSTDGTVRTPIAKWNQPSYDINADDQKGTFFQLHVQGVDSAVAVPEASTWAQLAMGLAGLAVVARRRRIG